MAGGVVSAVDIDQEQARRAQLAMFAGPKAKQCLLEIRGRLPGGRVRRLGFLPASELQLVSLTIATAAKTGDVWVTAAPRNDRDGRATAVPYVACLWVDLDGLDSLMLLRDFPIAPSMVIRSGSPDSAHAYWALQTPLDPRYAQRANRRLALALGGDQNATDAARILRPAGTSNYKHDPPRPVVCTVLTGQVYDAQTVVGDLPDTVHYTKPKRRFLTIRRKGNVSGLVRFVGTAPEGQRNAILFWASCRVVEQASAGYLDQGEALELLQDAALDCGLTEHEVSATIRSAQRHGIL